MMFDYTLGLQGTFCQNGQKMTIFLKLRIRSENIIFSLQKKLFRIPDIILRIWVNFHKKILVRYRYTSILEKSANFGTFASHKPILARALAKT
jgi:hypothetical protein